MQTADVMTIRLAAEQIGIYQWQLSRLYERGLLAKPEKFGPFRMVRAADLPQIREVAVAAGYLKTSPVGTELVVVS